MATLGPIVMAMVQRCFPSETSPAEEAKKGWETDLGDFLRAKFMRTGQSRKTPGAWSDMRAHSESDLGEEVKEEAENQYWYSIVLGAERRFQIWPDTCKHLVEARRLELFLPTSFPIVSFFWN